MPKTIFDFRAGKPIWCGHCGNYSMLTALFMSLSELDIEPRDLVVVSGIGCSSRLPGFVKNYGFHSAHGRAIPIATGVKLANPKLTVVVVTGDGDALGIGGGHLLHALRRNVDLTCLLVDNGLYGMTKGQPSPTTPFGVPTSTTPYGNPDTPVNPVSLAVTLGCGFVARGYTGNIESLKSIMVDAVRHKGTSLIHTLSPCPTFNTRETYKYFFSRVEDLPDTHDPSDFHSAVNMSADPERLYTGVFHRSERADYGEFADNAREKAGMGDIAGMIERFR